MHMKLHSSSSQVTNVLNISIENEASKPWSCSHLLLTQTAAAAYGSQYLWLDLDSLTILWGLRRKPQETEIVDQLFHTIMLVKLVDEGAHAIVPQLDDAVVQASQNPGPFRVETQPYRNTHYNQFRNVFIWRRWCYENIIMMRLI